MEPRLLCDASDEFFSTACFDGLFRRVLTFDGLFRQVLLSFINRVLSLSFFRQRFSSSFYSIKESQVN